MNSDLRKKIVTIIKNSGEGHIPSSFSIIDILDYIYGNVLRQKKKDLKKIDRNYFVLSKGHAAAAFFVVLSKYGFITNKELMTYGKKYSNLGGHPDMTKVPGVEASTGSLGHGFPTSVGIAMGLKIRGNNNNNVYCLVGDGECHEGTIWESANIAANNKLNNLIVIVDRNKSAQQLMPIENMEKKWNAFGWKTFICNGHSKKSLDQTFKKIKKNFYKSPICIIANTIKGKGVSFIEGHGPWHHKIPNDVEFDTILKELNDKK
jgi:transketolase